MTTLGELRNKFSAVHKQYNSTAFELSKKLNETKELIKRVPEGDKLFGEQAAVLELQYNAVKDQQKIYDDFIHQFMDKWDAEREMVSAKQNAEAEGDYYKEMGKILAVAMRMFHGDIVPGSDEKKLMEFDSDLYQLAKIAQMMAKLKERKKYDSLWDDEEKKELEDPIEAADAKETSLEAPEVVSVDEVIAKSTEG